jgi:hypothetical protein
MVFKRNLFKKKQLLLKYNFQKIELVQKIKKSLLRNHFNNYKLRLSFTVHNYEQNISDSNIYFKTFQKLMCPYSLCKKVPSRHLLFSRFFLNKQINSLKINNLLK